MSERIDTLTHQINVSVVTGQLAHLEELARQDTGTRQKRLNDARKSIVWILHAVEDYLPADIKEAVKRSQELVETIEKS